MENWQRAGFGNEHIFRVARTENALACLHAAHHSLWEAGYRTAAAAVLKTYGPAMRAVGSARAAAERAGYPLNQGWPEDGEKIV